MLMVVIPFLNKQRMQRSFLRTVGGSKHVILFLMLSACGGNLLHQESHATPQDYPITVKAIDGNPIYIDKHGKKYPLQIHTLLHPNGILQTPRHSQIHLQLGNSSIAITLHENSVLYLYAVSSHTLSNHSAVHASDGTPSRQQKATLHLRHQTLFMQAHQLHAFHWGSYIGFRCINATLQKNTATSPIKPYDDLVLLVRKQRNILLNEVDLHYMGMAKRKALMPSASMPSPRSPSILRYYLIRKFNEHRH